MPSALPAASAEPAAAGRTWAIATTAGFTVEGYLPAWAEEDPSATGVPLDRLSVRLADVGHWTHFGGQSMRVRSPASEGEGGGEGEEQVFWGSIDCHPFAEDPELREPVVSLAVIGDFWINDLDPDGLARVAAQLRAQADRLDHEIRPQLVAARADWADRQMTRVSPALSVPRASDRGTSVDPPVADFP